MGPPPSYVVTRRLVRNFFRKYIPNKPEGSEISEDALFDCWVFIVYVHVVKEETWNRSSELLGCRR